MQSAVVQALPDWKALTGHMDLSMRHCFGDRGTSNETQDRRPRELQLMFGSKATYAKRTGES